MNILMTALFDANTETAGKTHFSALCRCFAGAGHSVTALLPVLSNRKFRNQLEKDGVRVTCSLPLQHHILEYMLLGWARTLQLAWICFRQNPDALYVRVRTSAPFFCLAARIIRPGLLIVSEHPGWVPFQLRVCGAGRLPQVVAKWSHVLNARFSTRVRVVANGIGKMLEHHGIRKDKIFVAGNGTDTRHFRPMPRNDAIKQTGLDAEARYVGFAGTLEHWQGLEFLVKAFAALCAKRSCVDLLIVGDGPERRKLTQLCTDLKIQDRCTFTGQIPHAMMPAYINCFTVGVVFKTGLDQHMDSLYASLKLRDYAACGIPILASADASDHAIVEQAGIGKLIDPQNQEAVLQALLDFVDNPATCEQMGQIARATAEAGMDWEQTAGKILTYMDSGRDGDL